MPTRGASDRLGVLVAAGGASWESAALRGLGGPGLGVVRRCVDVADLLATAATGAAEVAVLAGDLTGLDAGTVLYLLRHDVRAVGVVADADTGRALRRLGVVEVVGPPGDDPAGQTALADACRRAAAQELVVDPDPEPDVALPAPAGGGGRTIAVWGPAGSPGRTTVAIGVAAELAARGQRTVLADLDPWGGAVAQHLGILDEASGLLAAARLANAGELDQRRFAGTRRLVGERLEVLTGLPRPDRWVEVRGSAVAEILGAAAALGHVVADTGFCLEDASGPGAGLGRSGGDRNRLTLDALAEAEEVVVVGGADPVGLTRLARGLVDLADVAPGARVRVVVNRMRDSLGWAESDIRGMVEGFCRPRGVHFLPDDRAACDRALVEGHALTESGDSPLRRAVADLVDAMVPGSVTAAPHRRFRRS